MSQYITVTYLGKSCSSQAPLAFMKRQNMKIFFEQEQSVQTILNAGQSKIIIRSTAPALQRTYSEASVLQIFRSSVIGSAGHVLVVNCKVWQAILYSTFLIASQYLSHILYESCWHCDFLFSSYWCVNKSASVFLTLSKSWDVRQKYFQHLNWGSMGSCS